MHSGLPSQSTSQGGFPERTCSVLTTLSKVAGTVTLAMGDDAPGSSLPEGTTRRDGQLVVDLALFPALTEPAHSLWVAEAEVIVVHRSQQGEDYLAFSSDCPNHQTGEGQTGESIFESDSPSSASDRCPSFQALVGGDGAPASEDDSDLRQLPLTRKGTMLYITLDS